MNTKVKMLDENNLDMKVVEEAGETIRNGGLVVFPTETVYGLGANALNPEAVKNIFKAKGRPQDNPLIVHIADMKNMRLLVQDISPIALNFMKKFWPGPLTIILHKSSIIPDITSACLQSVGIRMPSNIIARELIKAAKVPIAAPSANISGKPSPTYVDRCIEDLNGKVDIILGADMCDIGVESTVIDCTVSPSCVLRPGGITLEMLKEVEKNIYIDPAIMKKMEVNNIPKAPGMKYRHYAPNAPLKIVKGDLDKVVVKVNEIIEEYISEHKIVGIMATDETREFYKNALVISVGSRHNMLSISKNLFETLRSFDDNKVDVIISEAFEEKGIGLAVMNRLNKSAGFDIISV